MQIASLQKNYSIYPMDRSKQENEEPRTWQGFGQAVLGNLHRGWMCFDKWAGWLIGLDNSKYQWAVAEYHLQKQEEEREVARHLRAEDHVRQNMEEGLQPGAAAEGPQENSSSGRSPSGVQVQMEMSRPPSKAIAR
ncbi:hypothetical protein Agub_g139 [Astrephomene gubernaculifera]|uniref:Uncharacterized protein n=1 Tax=Astrephomene gubernaculifera TaxID=47775 RepID=A0AAD3DFF6_9CHLO|nr:hypothetical protein Agub_g139 [Astrephomene gubernaculifera]